MRPARTLSRYVLREVSLYTLLGLAAITLVLVSRNLLRHLDELIASGASGSEVLALLAYLVCVLATYVLPVAFLFGVLLAMSRLASDVEITAMRCCGIGVPSLLVPVAALGLVVSALTAFLAGEVEYRAQRQLRLHVQSMAAEGKAIEPGTFRRVGDRVLFARRRGVGDRLEGVLIADRSDPDRSLLIFAENGELAWDDERRALRLRLRNGDIHLDSRENPRSPAGPPAIGEPYRRIAFATFDYALDVDEILGVDVAAYRPREMSADDLRDVIARAEAGDPLTDMRRNDPVYYRLQLERRRALPIAPFLFALVAVPLGARRARGGRSWGAFACALLAFGYYGLMTFGQALALEGSVSATAALWLPNAVFAGLAGVLVWRSGRLAGRA